MIYVVYDVKRYRQLLSDVVEEDSVVIEIGPHVGKSTLSYIQKARLAVVVDLGEQSKAVFSNLGLRYPQLKFIHGDARSFSTVKDVLSLTKGCDVLAVDLGGGRYPDTVFKVWAIWSGIFKPNQSIIRNRGIAEFMQRAKIMDESLVKQFPDDGWLSCWGRSMPSKLRNQLEEFRLWVDLRN